MYTLSITLILLQLIYFVVAIPPPISNITVRAPSSFTHPGVLLNINQLNFIRTQVNNGAQPWASAYTSMMADDLASQSRQPSPYSSVECGPYSNPNIGCTNERQDALAAYANALAWYITQNSAYAQKAISYFNAWSYTIQSHTNSNTPLQTGWSGTSWARAAEIIRYTYNGWAAADITQFENMLRNVYLPEIINGSNSNGNWELVMMEAAQGIAVFLDDKTSYDKVKVYGPRDVEGGEREARNAFNIDPKELRNRFLKMQKACYPDRWEHCGEGHAALAASQSAQINKAYQTLLSPRLRGEYILSRQEVDISEAGNMDNEQELMMEVMEAREELENAEGEEVNELLAANKEVAVMELEHALSMEDWEEARRAVIRLRYWESFQHAGTGQDSDH